MSEKELSPSKTLAWIQAQVKAPKAQFNAFGKYKYRSAEDILEAVKVVINPIGYYITINDQVIQLGDRFYVLAHVELTNGYNRYTATAYAREESEKKGMDGAQITGAASSYARKYALSGLFALDDSALDPDKSKADESDLDWSVALANCKNQSELLKLFEENKLVISANPNIKALFTKRKSELK